MASITLSETARLLNQFQERIDTLDRYINDKMRVSLDAQQAMRVSLDAQQAMREAIIKRDELTNTMRVIIAEAQS